MGGGSPGLKSSVQYSSNPDPDIGKSRIRIHSKKMVETLPFDQMCSKRQEHNKMTIDNEQITNYINAR